MCKPRALLFSVMQRGAQPLSRQATSQALRQAGTGCIACPAWDRQNAKGAFPYPPVTRATVATLSGSKPPPGITLSRLPPWAT